MTAGLVRVEFCNWCPDPANPSAEAHPDGGPRHRHEAMTEALRDVCETALYWSAAAETIAAVRVLLPQQVDELLSGL